MKLLIELDEELLARAMKATGAKTKREAVIIPMKEYLRGKLKQKFLAREGKGFPTTLGELLDSRRKWKNY